MFKWKVLTIKDNGPRQHYRYNISGLIINGDREPKEFHWSVPNLDDSTYDTAEAKILESVQ